MTLQLRWKISAAICAGVMFGAVVVNFGGHGVKVGDVYRDVYGTKYTVIAVHDRKPDGEPFKKPFVVLKNFTTNKVYMPRIEDLDKPLFTKE